MNSQKLRHLLFAVCLLTLLASNGCAWGHSYFQLDSNSSSPWFGFDLLSR